MSVSLNGGGLCLGLSKMSIDFSRRFGGDFKYYFMWYNKTRIYFRFDIHYNLHNCAGMRTTCVDVIVDVVRIFYMPRSHHTLHETLRLEQAALHDDRTTWLAIFDCYFCDDAPAAAAPSVAPRVTVFDMHFLWRNCAPSLRV